MPPRLPQLISLKLNGALWYCSMIVVSFLRIYERLRTRSGELPSGRMVRWAAADLIIQAFPHFLNLCKRDSEASRKERSELKMKKFFWPFIVTLMLLSLKTVIGSAAEIGEVQPLLIDSDAPEINAFFKSGQSVHLKCKSETGHKIWVLLQLPLLYPDTELARPSEVYCLENGRNLFSFSQSGIPADEAGKLYYADSCSESKIDFGKNDFTGLGELIVTVKKGEEPDRLEVIQTIRISENTDQESVSSYSYEITRVYPHDPNAFTQGLVFRDGFLYESTGLYGRSTLRKVELETGAVLKSLDLPASLFAEGLTLYGDQLIQLTWTSGIGFVYDMGSFRMLRTFNYKTEGWGITHDGKHLIVSDGTSTLYFLDPGTFEEVRRIEVTDNGTKIEKLNELEYVNGEIYANVWFSDRIAKISPETGRVIGWIDFGAIVKREHLSSSDRVLNGIAYDLTRDRFFITGKFWPELFEIKLIPEK